MHFLCRVCYKNDIVDHVARIIAKKLYGNLKEGGMLFKYIWGKTLCKVSNLMYCSIFLARR